MHRKTVSIQELNNTVELTRWLTVAEAAETMQISPRLVYQLVSEGRLRAARIGARRQIRMRGEWIDHFFDRVADQQQPGAIQRR